MSQINGAKRTALTDQGYTGHIDEQELAWLKGLGATKDTIPDAWDEYLRGEGYTGSLNDMKGEWMTALGYTGNLSKKLYDFWAAGGTVYAPILILNHKGLFKAPSAGATLSNTSTDTDATVIDHEGVIRPMQPGEVRYSGGRNVYNYQPEPQADKYFVASGTTPPIVTDQVIYQGESCTRIVMDETMDIGYSGCRAQRQSPAVLAPMSEDWGEAVSSIYVALSRALTGSEEIQVYWVNTLTDRLKINSSNSSGLVGELKRLNFYRSVVGAENSKRLTFYVNSALSSEVTIYVCKEQIERTDGSTVQVASEYLADIVYNAGIPRARAFDTLNGNTVDANDIIAEATGADITPAPTILHEGAATNSVVNNCFSELGLGDPDFFADWTEATAGTSTIAEETADVPGGIRTVCKFTTDGSSSVVSVSQTKRLNIGAGAVATASLYAKCANSSGLAFQIIADDGAGGSVEYLNAAGTAWQAGATVFTPSNLPTAWAEWTHTLPATNTGRTHVRIERIESATGASATHRFTSVKLEAGSYATTPIKTTTAAVTRDVDQIQISDIANWFPQARGAFIFKVTFGHDSESEASQLGLLSTSASNDSLLSLAATTDGKLDMTDGTNRATFTDTFSAGDTRIIVGFWDEATLNDISLGWSDDNGTTWGTWNDDPYDSAFVLGTVLELMRQNDHINDVHSLLIYDRLPASTLAGTKTWFEDNAVQEITDAGK